jgi:hypothetical protein
MSERIDVLAGATIAGAGGDAVRGKGPALTQWVDAAVLSESRAAHPQLHLERRLEASHGRP